jgi:hypothetical protein
MKSGPEAAERHPFGERLEVIHRLDRFDFDDRLNFMSAVRRREDHVRVNCCRAAANRAVLLGAGVYAHIEATAKAGLQEAYHAIVFELLADRPDEDGTHEIATITWKGTK